MNKIITTISAVLLIAVMTAPFILGKLVTYSDNKQFAEYDAKFGHLSNEEHASAFGFSEGRNSDLLDALWMVESSQQFTVPRGKAGEIGPYQIGEAYWIDSRVEGTWDMCNDKKYAERVILSYMHRYCKEAWESNDHEVIARIHNGGPKGATKTSTIKYWNKVRMVLLK